MLCLRYFITPSDPYEMMRQVDYSSHPQNAGKLAAIPASKSRPVKKVECEETIIENVNGEETENDEGLASKIELHKALSTASDFQIPFEVCHSYKPLIFLYFFCLSFFCILGESKVSFERVSSSRKRRAESHHSAHSASISSFENAIKRF